MSLIPVALTFCPDYEPSHVETSVSAVLDASGWAPARGSTVLVKPNLLKALPLACTHPLVVHGACVWLLERGIKVIVADSPGFGTARGVAGAIGLDKALGPLGLSVQELNRPVRVPLGGGKHGHWGVARLALECDAVLSIPKVKAHSMMRLSLSVKNLFGCVCGLRKAHAHARQGNKPGLFEVCLVDLFNALPPVAALADGIESMHVTGPVAGEPYRLGLLAASCNAVALDAALGALLGAQAQDVPVWTQLQHRNLPGAVLNDIAYPLDTPDKFAAGHFILPALLDDVSFHPRRLLVSLCRRVWNRWRG